MTDRPFVSLDPAMRSGQPTLNCTRLPVETVGELWWHGDSEQVICEGYDITRGQLLVACWYLGIYGTPRWRRRWRAWAEEVSGALWSARSEPDYRAVPDPPSRES